MRTIPPQRGTYKGELESVLVLEEDIGGAYNEEQCQFARNHHHNTNGSSTVGTGVSELASLD